MQCCPTNSAGGDYSTKFAPWLAHGCLSPRTIYHEIKRCAFVPVSHGGRRDAERVQGTPRLFGDD